MKMLFSSIPFLYFFLPFTLLLYFIVPKKLKNAVLLVMSLLFYAWGEKMLVILFILTIVTGWILGLLIERFRGKKWDKVCMILSVIIDLGLLGYFKYADFFISNVNALTGTGIPLLKVALPIGISFYTFQILSYTIDVYRGTVPAQKNLIDFGAYVALFPQLIAGPIVRYADIAAQLKNRTHSVDMAAEGTRRFMIGLGKKILIANIMGEVCSLFRQSTDLSVLYYWLYAISYMLQIYFDFSGYSDMAIGLGKIFGFRFMENFDHPYMSVTITEFWRRWHISLGSWFRDYVYIPLGGNRKGKARQLLNILIVWMLTGFWHGASWNFILWGLFYAILLTVEKLWTKKWLEKHALVGHVYVLLMVLFGFVLFNGADLPGTWKDISGLFAFRALPLVSTEAMYYLKSFGLIMVIAILGTTSYPVRWYHLAVKKLKLEHAMTVVEPVLMAVLLLVVTGYLVDGSFNPFLYFRF